MGALHEGHLSLVRYAQERCDEVLVSIFVNPTQFGPNEDFHRYPRPLENDLALLQSVGTPKVFVPSVSTMYPAGFETSVHVGGLSTLWEGRSRPGHFDGVATVVLKLFQASEADTAFFGQKDFQQAAVIRKMIADLNLPIELVVCPIVRESDGLAMSSRNRYLSELERSQATALHQALLLAEELIHRQGIRNTYQIKESLRTRFFNGSENGASWQLDYIAVADPDTLEEPDAIDPEKNPQIVVLIAATLGTTRLIDNSLIQVQK